MLGNLLAQAFQAVQAQLGPQLTNLLLRMGAVAANNWNRSLSSEAQAKVNRILTIAIGEVAGRAASAATGLPLHTVVSLATRRALDLLDREEIAAPEESEMKTLVEAQVKKAVEAGTLQVAAEPKPSNAAP